MVLKNITFRNFRNYETLHLQFSAGVNLITGRNAQGKTNILEGIHYLSTAKSHRTNRDDELIQQGKQWFYLKGQVISGNRDEREREQGMGVSNVVEITNTCGERKRVRINGKTQDRISNIIGKINVVMFSPEDLSLIKGVPSERRRFLDILISQISSSYLYALQEYYSALRQRNELLKSIRDKKATYDLLDSWNVLLVKAGSEIIKKRVAVVSELSDYAEGKHKQLTSDQEELHIEYQSELDCDSRLERTYEEGLGKSTDQDIRRGTTSVGPHRDDLKFAIDNVDARRFCSQGQQRTAVLSLKLANLELMRRYLEDYPIILLDDVTSELDDSRALYLFALLRGISVQTFLTATSLGDIPSDFSKCRHFHVENGQVRIGNRG